MRIHYTLEVWNKITRRYDWCWSGQDLERAKIMANKRYNNEEWHGKRRIICHTYQIVEIFPRRRIRIGK